MRIVTDIAISPSSAHTKSRARKKRPSPNFCCAKMAEEEYTITMPMLVSMRTTVNSRGSQR